MNRRTIVATGLAMPLFVGLVHAGSQTAGKWKHRILSAGFDGAGYVMGLEIALAEGWKTYWRVPGNGGIPPNIAIEGGNVAEVAVRHPAPERFSDASGETIGYHGTVVFPILVIPQNNAQPVYADFKSFIGVCEEICIPVSINEHLFLEPNVLDSESAATIGRWQARVPQVSSDLFPVISLHAEDNGLRGELAAQVDDIFIETQEELPVYFSAPVANGNTVHIKAAGKISGNDLKGRKLRVTSITKTTALEQMLTVV